MFILSLTVSLVLCLNWILQTCVMLMVNILCTVVILCYFIVYCVNLFLFIGLLAVLWVCDFVSGVFHCSLHRLIIVVS